MFFRIKPSGERRYLQIVENTRDGASTRQRVLATLGRVEDLEADGRLDALLRSGARFSETALLISSLHAHSVDRDRPIRPNVITESGDRDHALTWCHGGQWRAAWPGSGRCH